MCAVCHVSATSGLMLKPKAVMMRVTEDDVCSEDSHAGRRGKCHDTCRFQMVQKKHLRGHKVGTAGDPPQVADGNTRRIQGALVSTGATLPAAP